MPDMNVIFFSIKKNYNKCVWVANVFFHNSLSLSSLFEMEKNVRNIIWFVFVAFPVEEKQTFDFRNHFNHNIISWMKLKFFFVCESVSKCDVD